MAKAGVWEWDVTRDEVRWSDVLYDIFGEDPATFQPNYGIYMARVHPDDRAEVESLVQEAFRTGQPYEVRHRVRHADGTERWVHSKGEVVQENGKTTLMRGVALDVTESMEVVRLRELNQFRARFINVAAHELKTPLTPLKLQVQLLDEHLKAGPEPAKRSVAVLKRSVDRLSRLVDDVLDAARIQAIQLKIETEPVDFSAVVTESLESYEEVAEQVHVSLQQQVVPSVVVAGDHTRLLQVVNNVLSNALKFTPSGGSVHVELFAEHQEAVLRVEDSGRGFEPEKAAQLFQPFVRLHDEHSSSVRGTGLGLFIVKSIVESHGGTVSVTSPGPMKGTTVEVRIPLAPGSPEPRPPTSRSSRRQRLSERLRDIV